MIPGLGQRKHPVAWGVVVQKARKQPKTKGATAKGPEAARGLPQAMFETI